MISKLDPKEQSVGAMIDRVGWMFVHVTPSVDDRAHCWFSYTWGLAVMFGWPELIRLDLGRNIAGEMLNAAVREIKQRARSCRLQACN